VRTSFLPGLALWSLFPRPQSHGPTFWTVFYGKRLVNAETAEVGTGRNLSDFPCQLNRSMQHHLI
jgi:hypothetical protein